MKEKRGKKGKKKRKKPLTPLNLRGGKEGNDFYNNIHPPPPREGRGGKREPLHPSPLQVPATVVRYCNLKEGGKKKRGEKLQYKSVYLAPVYWTVVPDKKWGKGKRKKGETNNFYFLQICDR